MPPALSEIYDGPRSGWLRDILEYLPCLQCLMVSNLPFFDYNAMAALKSQESSVQYNIRLLLADHEPNTTSSILAETLLRFPLLIYLDLSYTRSARDRGVLASISQLPHLQVLKLRGIGLKDADAEFLANAIEKRVRFLDVRNNMLTDMAVRSLLQASFQAPGQVIQPLRRTGTSPDPYSHSVVKGPGSELLKSPRLDEHYAKILSRPSTGHTWIEDLPPSGITHLYISHNDLTVEGVAGLLASYRLHALDAGMVHTADFIHKKTLSPKRGKYPGSEKLVPVIGNIAGAHLTYLRSHHALVTAEPPAKDSAPLGEFLPELPPNRVANEHELDASNDTQVYELPGHDVPIFELADTSLSEPANPATATGKVQPLPTPYEDEQLPSARRGSAFAPEVVRSVSITNQSDIGSPTLSYSGLPRSGTGQTLSSLPSVSALDYDTHSTNTISSIPLCSSSISGDNQRAQMIQELISKRPRNQSLPLRGGKESRYPYLHPSHIPHLETLVLTDIPSHIPHNSPILYTLTRFITACSQEALLATLQAGSDYSLPPGQSRLRAEQQRSRALFGLRRIILEITDTSTRLSSWKPASQRNNPTVSSTGDRDSESLWAAAADDFSFFDDLECGIPANDQGKYFPMAALNEKVTLMPSDDDSTHSGTDSPLPHPSTLQGVTSAASSTHNLMDSGKKGQQGTLVQDVDLVAELAAFRRSKKAEYERVVRRERGRRSISGSGLTTTSTSPRIAMTHFVEGHWKGEVKIVRNPILKGRSGVVDVYGNYFEKGYLYP
ncbi:hypothetical protein N7470_003618 [Penicillium chermesinum]|nr:hypothetical protein N7470_003618 [Penicillium chermesinum]